MNDKRITKVTFVDVLLQLSSLMQSASDDHESALALE